MALNRSARVYLLQRRKCPLGIAEGAHLSPTRSGQGPVRDRILVLNFCKKEHIREMDCRLQEGDWDRFGRFRGSIFLIGTFDHGTLLTALRAR